MARARAQVELKAWGRLEELRAQEKAIIEKVKPFQEELERLQQAKESIIQKTHAVAAKINEVRYDGTPNFREVRKEIAMISRMLSGKLPPTPEELRGEPPPAPEKKEA